MSETLPADVREILDAHLDAVESALASAGQPRTARKSIVEDLESQILDMVTARAGSRPPEISDIEAILAKLDPPQAYATGRPLPSSPRPRPNRPTPPREWPRAIALIFLMLCGLLLIAWPSVADRLAEQAGAELLARRTDLTSISMTRGQISGEARFGFWLTGTIIMLGGVAAMIAWTNKRR